jgi:hypothetical protein
MLASRTFLRTLTLAAISVVALGAPALGQGPCVPRFEPAPQMPYPEIANRGTSDTVFASVLWDPDGSGYKRPRLVVAGAFTTAGGNTANRVAMWDGTTWQVVGPQGFNAAVNALAVVNGTLYAGGAFTATGATSCNRVARFNAATNAWVQVGNGFDGDVDALEGHEDLLYAGGHFTHSGATTTRHIAQFNGTAWVEVDGGANGNVLALQSFGGRLYVGGQFTQINAVNRSGIAFWTSAGSWSTMGAGINPSNNYVRCFEIQGTDLLIGGKFAWIGSATTVANNLARYTPSGSAGTFTGITNFTLQGFQVNAILPIGLEIYAGGTDGTYTVLRFDGSAWSRDASSNSPGLGQTVHTLSYYENEVHAGGVFGFFNGGLSANNITRRHDGQWEPLHPRLNGPVYAFANYSGLSVGGAFEQSMPDFSAAMGLLTYNPSNGFFGSLGVVNAAVYSLFVSSNLTTTSRLYAAGELFSAGTSLTNANDIASWTGPIGTGGPAANWSGVANGVTNSSNPFFSTLNATAGFGFTGSGINRLPILHIGGMFSHANGVACNNVAKLVAGNWQPLGGGMTSASSLVVVRAMINHSGQLIAAGEFDAAGGLTSNSIAAWNGTSWSPLGLGLRMGAGRGWVFALSSYNGELFAGGRFDSAGGVSGRNLASWNGTAWTIRNAGILNPTVEEVLAFGQLSGDLFCATSQIVSGAPVSRVYKWNGSAWSIAGGTADGYIFTLFPYSGKLQVGGSFLHAGRADSRYWAQLACVCPADLDDGSGAGTPDGGVTIDDLIYFLVMFDAGNLAADIDDGSGLALPDGGVTIDDLLYFLARYEIGC